MRCQNLVDINDVTLTVMHVRLLRSDQLRATLRSHRSRRAARQSRPPLSLPEVRCNAALVQLGAALRSHRPRHAVRRERTPLSLPEVRHYAAPAALAANTAEPSSENMSTTWERL